MAVTLAEFKVNQQIVEGVFVAIPIAFAGGSFANPWYISLYLLFVILALPRILSAPAYWIANYKLGFEYFPPETSQKVIEMSSGSASLFSNMDDEAFTEFIDSTLPFFACEAECNRNI
jgi:hypothetical protein